MKTFITKQSGAATLLFLLLAALALMAGTASALYAISGAQRQQYTEHIATQAQLNAWAGVSALSSAISTLSAAPALTANGTVQFTGLASGTTAKYIGTTAGGYLEFYVTGTSAGATSTLAVAYSLPGSGGSGSGSTPVSSLPSGIEFHGNTILNGAVTYTGTSANLMVYGGNLTLGGSVSGLNQVCASGAVTVTGSNAVGTICSGSSVTLSGSSTATTINAVGDVDITGGASTVGTINSNGAVNLSGGSASATTINATGNVTVGNGAADGVANPSTGDEAATTINTQGNVIWNSALAPTTINANGMVVDATTSGSTTTTINAIGNVWVSEALNVNSDGNVGLIGYWNEGISGTLKAQGSLSQSAAAQNLNNANCNWSAYGGCVVAAGTIGGTLEASPPSTVHVTVHGGYTVPIATVSIPAVTTPTDSPVTVDAYQLESQANFAFTGVDSHGNPIVTVNDIAGVPNGTYFIANDTAISSGGDNYLCASVSGSNCSSAGLAKICQGFSGYNACFSYSSGTWTVQGTVMLPSVLWFQGNLDISSGSWTNTFIATGNIITSGALTLDAPNYVSTAAECGGTASPAQVTSYGMASTNYATQLCSGSPLTPTKAAIGNIALLAGGYSAGVFSGGDITLGSSNVVNGIIMAGQYITTNGSTTVAGAMYSAGEAGTTSGSNSESGATTINVSGGSSAYNPTQAPCVGSACTSSSGPAPATNIVWVAPI